MALSTKAGNFALNTSTGNQSITGVGFQPKAVFFMISPTTTNGIVNHMRSSFGVGISSSARGECSFVSEDNLTTSDTGRDHSNAHSGRIFNTAVTALEVSFDFVSNDSDGFTINVVVAPATAYRVSYFALGGTDVKNVGTGTFVASTSAGNQSITGVGFQPAAIVLFSSNIQTAPPTAQAQFVTSFGFASGTTQRGSISYGSIDNVTTTEAGKFSQTDACYVSITSGGVVDAEADLVSFDSDGFTINWSNPPTNANYIFYFAIKGPKVFVGDLLTQTSTGNFSETGIGFKPKAGMFLSYCDIASATIRADAEYSLGFVTDTSNRFTISGWDDNNVTTTNNNSSAYDNKVYVNLTQTGSVDGDIDFVSWDNDGFTLNQTDADPTQNVVIYFVIGQTPGLSAIERKYGRHIGRGVMRGAA